MYDGYSKIVIQVSDDVEYTAGTDSGRTLTLSCQWGNQEMAERILSRVKGFQYQPYTASGAYLDPAAELGDGVTIGKVYSGIFSKKVHHGPLYTADISAPGGEKINYQHPYKSPQDRIVSRQFRDVRASLSIQSDKISAEVEERQKQYGLLRATLNVQAQQIEAKVSKEGGDTASFSWKLLENMFSVSGKSEEKFRVDEDGAYVNGIIRATGGEIGGLKIMPNYLSYNGQTWGGTNTTGAYIGPNGIQCGSAENGVRITSSGDLYAENGYFRGSVNAGNIQYGGGAGYLNGSGLESHSVYGSQIGYNTISTAYTSNGINASLANADYAYGCVKGWNTIPALHAGSLDTNDLTIEKRQIDRATIRYMNSSGGVSTAKVLVWI